jgi:release factor glutamine methyltransferase
VSTWRAVWVRSAEAVGADDARRIVQRVSGLEGTAWALGLDERANDRLVRRVDDLVQRRSSGEPLQYVLGAWGFRHLDLMVDPRVLIPRPETEVVVDVALDAARQRLGSGRVLTLVDLGTGSGAIALSLAAELPAECAEIWATDASPAALDVARANLAGLGRAARFVSIASGEWFAALPSTLAGAIDLVVSNPPYIGASEPLPDEVRLWEPTDALVAGPTGVEAIEHIVNESASWLAPGGALVLEIGATQGRACIDAAERAGLTSARIHQDLARRDRVLSARRSPTPP